MGGNISCAALSESHAHQGLGQDDIRSARVSRFRMQLYTIKVKVFRPAPLPFYDNARQPVLHCRFGEGTRWR